MNINENKISVVGVRFISGVKIYYFLPENFSLKRGDYVVVESQQGQELAKVVYENLLLDKQNVDGDELLSIVRLATDDDKKNVLSFYRERKDYLEKAMDLVKRLKLQIKLIDVSKSLDEGGRLLFLFAADGRVDFRDLLTLMSSEFKSPIRLYQVGPRDAARMIGGVGICGQKLCCSRFLNRFESITMEMAREQDLINVGSNKISGVCGKLLCCLEYELEMYKKLCKEMSNVGELVQAENKRAIVIERNVLSQTIMVEFEDDRLRKVFPVNEIVRLGK